MDTTTTTKKPTDKKINTESAKAQDQVLDAIKRSQDATLQIVQAWSDSVTKLTSNFPELPKMPVVDALPKPDEVTDQFFHFAQQVMTTQQEFVKKLIEALPSQDVASK
jgi:3-methyladenine DNA glycosylase AlkC